MTKIFTPKNEKKFYCIFCDYGSNKKTDYNIHVLTNKHKMLKMAKNTNKIPQNLANNIFTCDCGKVYKHQSSLCKHKLKCKYQKEESNDDMKALIVKIMKDNSEKMNFLINENKELRTQIKEQNQQITELIPKVGNNNNNNLKQKFNINLFLNENVKMRYLWMSL